MTKPGQNQAEYDRAKAELDNDPRVEEFRSRIIAMFPTAGYWISEPFRNGNHVFVWVNGCTTGWTPGTPANYSVGIYIPGLCYNGGGATVEGAIRRANEYFDDWVAEQATKLIARVCNNDPNHTPRAPWRQVNWDD